MDEFTSAGLITEGFAVCEPEKPVACAGFGCSLIGELTGVFGGVVFDLISIMKRPFTFTAKFCRSKRHGDGEQ